ncbi:TetR/AcrR family transcriptional regulator [Symbioplanes lichenis]|uniref:TetR/AcrR family transcriptional regulator n=1 Tax=Symbioplanes lichenis TaxID=1629072 RepID=UPI00273919AD|nr:TetR/AcrR family transcriptional regulator [Actinoplanes lichenis]
MVRDTYHHGDLRRVLLAEAARAIEEAGPAALSLRDIARRAEVSHAAPTHHFGDKKGLLTALAAEGFTGLAAALEDSWVRDRSRLELGVTYVRYAVGHRAHFEVMFHPDLCHATDRSLLNARGRVTRALHLGTNPATDTATNPETAGLALWSAAHGLATLWNGGALPACPASPDDTARAVMAKLT